MTVGYGHGGIHYKNLSDILGKLLHLKLGALLVRVVRRQFSPHKEHRAEEVGSPRAEREVE